MLVQIVDRLDAGRCATVDGGMVLPVIAGWLNEDGFGELGELSPTVKMLSRAVALADWGAVHLLADMLSFDVEVA